MAHALQWLYVCLLLGLANALPLENNLEEGSYVEGDIRVIRDKNGVIAPARRWIGGIIPYKFHGTYSAAEKALVMTAIADYNRYTCIKWVPQTTQTDYVLFIKGTGCWSYLGRTGGKQDLNLQLPGCHARGTIVHEMMHTVGFWHEQSRPDRDTFVKIALENVAPGMESNFVKVLPTLATTLGVNYDYGSVMHYPPLAFSKNGKPTIIPLKPLNGAVMGQRNGFAPSDYWRINRMYGCKAFPQGP